MLEKKPASVAVHYRTLDEDEIERNLRSIMDDARVASNAKVAEGAVGVLTGDERAQWAMHRRMLHAEGEQNRRSFYDVDAALFVVCLDDVEQSGAAAATT